MCASVHWLTLLNRKLCEDARIDEICEVGKNLMQFWEQHLFCTSVGGVTSADFIEIRCLICLAFFSTHKSQFVERSNELMFFHETKLAIQFQGVSTFGCGGHDIVIN